MDIRGEGTAAEVKKCIIIVLVWLVDTLFTSVHACKLLRVADRRESLETWC